jgi:hypothetical protein
MGDGNSEKQRRRGNREARRREEAGNIEKSCLLRRRVVIYDDGLQGFTVLCVPSTLFIQEQDSTIFKPN